MTEPVSFFRIFLSSPGDIPQERDDAEAVVNEINATGEFSHHFILKLYRWDDKSVVLPMPVTDIPQKSVDIYMTLPSQCDLVMVLFWSRMGSPLVMDKQEYLSGTHYEYSEALQGYEQTGKPTVWLYRCNEEPSIKLTDSKRDEKIQQFDRVTQFFKQFQDTEGRYTGGVNGYDVHANFKDLFKGQLLTYLRHLRDKPTAEEPKERVAKKRFTGVPYRGLHALEETDAPIFFGRDAETLEVLNRVENKRLVFVLGASGSGKSSLVSAGVLPHLRKRGWRIIRCLPGENPYFNLALAMVSQIPEMDVKPAVYLSEAQTLAKTLAQQPENIVQQIVSTLPNEQVLLFIDQFEELFTLAEHNHNLPTGEVSNFMQAIAHSRANLTTLVTMRADFYKIALSHFTSLKQETYGLTKPSIFALLNLITHPAELAGLTIEDGLAQHIVESVGTESGALALVAYLMEALYLQAKARDETTLSWDDYNKLNGVQGAINTLADQAYDNLAMDNATREHALQTVFRELITLTQEDEQLIPSRKRAPLTAFRDDSNEAKFVEAFVNARLLVRDSASVEVAHDAILRHWGQLETWIEGNSEDLYTHQRLSALVTDWEEDGRKEGYLARGAQLEGFEHIAERTDRILGQSEQEFVNASVNHRKELRDRELRAKELQLKTEQTSKINARRLAMALGTLTVVVLVGLIAVLILRDEAVRAQVIAEANATIAEVNAIDARNQALVANAQIVTDSALAINLALEANANNENLPVLVQRVLADVAYAIPGARMRLDYGVPINAVATGPDEDVVLIALADRSLVLVNTSTGEEVQRFVGHTEAVNDVAVSPDGSMALSGSCAERDDDEFCAKGELILWDVATGEEIRRLEGHAEKVLSVAFAPDGNMVLSGSNFFGELFLWDVASGEEIRRLEGHSLETSVDSVAFSPNGHMIVSSDFFGEVILWDVVSGEEIRRLEGHSLETGIDSVAFSPDGQTILTGGDDTDVILWDVATGEILHRYTHRVDVLAVAFSPDGRFAVSGAEDSTIILFDVERREEIRRFSAHTGPITSLAFNASGRMLISGSKDNTIVLWDMINGAIDQRLTDNVLDFDIHEIVFDPQEPNQVFVGGCAVETSECLSDAVDSLILWDIVAETVISQFAGTGEGFTTSVALNSEGNHLLSATSDGNSYLWDVDNEEIIHSSEDRDEFVFDVAFSPDGQYALLGGCDTRDPNPNYPCTIESRGEILLWDIENDDYVPFNFTSPTGNIVSVAYSPDGTQAISSSAEEAFDFLEPTVILWDIETQTENHRLEGHRSEVVSVAFSPNSQFVLTGAINGEIILWDVSGTKIRHFDGHIGPIESLAFSPDGSLAVSGSSDTTVIAWNVASGQALRRFTDHNVPVFSVAFSPDGKTVFSGTQSGIHILWRIDSQSELLDWIHANRYLPGLTCAQLETYGSIPCDSA